MFPTKLCHATISKRLVSSIFIKHISGRLHTSRRYLTDNPNIKSPLVNSSAFDTEAENGQLTKQSISQSASTSDDLKLDMDLIHHLERTSLVDFDNEEALKRLQEAVQFANTLFEVDTTGVEPMTTVLEQETLYLRQDKTAPTSREEVLMNASLSEEDYFVAPPGNIPLEPQSKSVGFKS